MKLYTSNPNFSIVLPGCPADCKFCFNKEAKKVKGLTIAEFERALESTLLRLPKEFQSISITGGEPLSSKYLPAVLGLVQTYRRRFTRVVLTTNGMQLANQAKLLAGRVDYVNISRHHYDATMNRKIFRGSYVLPNSGLEEALKECSLQGVDVTLNCIINDSTTSKFINDYLDWTTKIGVSKVCFRKEAGDSLDIPAQAFQEFKKYRAISENTCPVCRSLSQTVRGKTITWKTSLVEPSWVTGGKVYELIFQADGKVYSDWNSENPVKLPQAKSRTPKSVGFTWSRSQGGNQVTPKSRVRTLDTFRDFDDPHPQGSFSNAYNSCDGVRTEVVRSC